MCNKKRNKNGKTKFKSKIGEIAMDEAEIIQTWKTYFEYLLVDNGINAMNIAKEALLIDVAILVTAQCYSRFKYEPCL